ncbi:MAG TPA: HEAT repeat domain-containing protein [Armatimonadota bacterium]|jgi:HEAT repeat protein
MFRHNVRFVLLTLLLCVFLPTKAADLSVLLLLAQSYNPQQRLEAVKALDDMQNPKAVPVLIKTLDDGDANVAVTAAKALGKMKDPRALEPLLAKTTAKDVPLRRAVFVALQGYKDSRVADRQLAALTDDDDYDVRMDAALALTAAKDMRAILVLANALSLGETPLDLTTYIKPGGLAGIAGSDSLNYMYLDASDAPKPDALPTVLANEQPQTRRLVLNEIIFRNVSAYGAPARDALLAVLAQERNPDRRIVLMAVLRRCGTARSVRDALAVRLQDDVPRVRDFAAYFLGKDADPRAITPLLALYAATQDAAIRTDLVGLFCHMDYDPRLIEPLIAQLQDRKNLDRDHILQIIDSLKRFGMDDARVNAYFLSQAAEDRDPQQHIYVLSMLRGIKRLPDPTVLRTMLQSANEQTLENLWTIVCMTREPRTFEVLQPFLQHPDAGVRKLAMRGIAILEDLRMFEPLANIAQHDTDAEVRETAVDGLAVLKDSRMRELLINIFQHDTDAKVRLSALYALKVKDDIRQVPLLKLALATETDIRVRAGILHSLACLKDPSVLEALIVLLQKDTDDNVRLDAADDLRLLGDTRAMSALRTALQQDANPRVRLGAAEALLALGEPDMLGPLTRLLTALQNEQSAVQYGVAKLIGTTKDLRAVAPLTAALAKNEPGDRANGGFIDALQEIALAHPGAPEFDPAVAQLTEKLPEIPFHLSMSLLITLGAMERPAAVAPVIAYFTNVKNGRSGHAYTPTFPILQSLAKIPSPSMVAYLHTLAEGAANQPESRESAIAVLSRQGDQKYVDYLYDTLTNTAADTPKHAAAVQALGEIGDDRAQAALLNALRDTDGAYRQSVIFALLQIHPKHSVAVVEPLAKLLKDPHLSGYTMCSICRWLGEVKDPRAVPPLLDALPNASIDQQLEIFDALVKIGDLRAVAPLTALLNSESAVIRHRAKEALEKFKGKR